MDGTDNTNNGLQISKIRVFILDHTRRFVLNLSELPSIIFFFLEICKPLFPRYIHFFLDNVKHGDNSYQVTKKFNSKTNARHPKCSTTLTDATLLKNKKSIIIYFKCLKFWMKQNNVTILTVFLTLEQMTRRY
jgi:hypothetical protein